MSDIVAPISLGRFAEKMEQVTVLMQSRRFREARKICEQVLTEASGAVRSQFEQKLCLCMVKTGDPGFQKLLHLFKADEQPHLKMVYAYEWDRDESLKAVVLPELDKAGQNGAVAASYYAAMLERRFEADAAFEVAFKALGTAKKKQDRKDLAEHLFYAAQLLGSEAKAEQALTWLYGKDRGESLAELDLLRHLEKQLSASGKDSEELFAQYLAGRLPAKRSAFRILDSEEESPDSYIGGFTDYDDKELEKEKAIFFAQLDLNRLPDPDSRKQKVLRLWLLPDAVYGGPGLYRNSAVIRVLKKGKPRGREPGCESISTYGMGCEFLRVCNLPDFSEPGFLRPEVGDPEQALQLFRPFRQQILGWPCRNAWAAALAPEDNFNLLQIPIGEVHYLFCMRPEDFRAGDFSAVSVIKGRICP